MYIYVPVNVPCWCNGRGFGHSQIVILAKWDKIPTIYNLKKNQLFALKYTLKHSLIKIK